MAERVLAERLALELEAVGGTVHRAGSTREAREKVIEILREKGARHVVRGNTPLLVELGLDDALGKEGVAVTVADLRATGREVLRAAEFEADAGVTSIDYGVAETGTLVVGARPGQGRAVSLLPPLHVAVLESGNIVPELGALFERLQGAPASAFTLITGPSRTADIELVLTVGVHGPGELHLVLIG